MKANDILSGIGSVLKRNENTIIGTLVTGGLYYAFRKLGMDISFGELVNGGRAASSGEATLDNTAFVFARNASEAAIKSTMDSAMDMTWDNSKIGAIRNIKGLVKDDADDDTKKFAITAISRIRSSLTWDSSKQIATSIIAEIAK